jgi:phasin family protein
LHNTIPAKHWLGSTTKEEAEMAGKLEAVQTFSKTQLESVAVTSQSFAKGLQTIAAETTEYSKKSLEGGTAFFERLLGVKSLESAIQLQSEYAKAAYAHFVEYVTKISELYSNLAKEALQPLEAVVAKAQSGGNWDAIQGNWTQFAGKINEKWAKLTIGDLAKINGNRETLEGKLRELYGCDNEQARKEIDNFLGGLK